MFSQTVEYSLRAVAALAARHDEPMTVEQISDVAHIPRPYLSKMMQTLVRADLVRSQRGRGGGFVLAKLPKKTTTSAILNHHFVLQDESSKSPSRRRNNALIKNEKGS